MTKSARLKSGAEYPDSNCPAELFMLRLPDSSNEEESPDLKALEAQTVAGRIKDLVKSRMQVCENGVCRDVCYGDIAILLRSPGSSGPVYRRALENIGIPVLSEQGGGFFSSLEISSMVSFLAVIDNPHQDIPLISSLRSPLFGFASDDLGRIRAAGSGGDFFDALSALRKKDKRIEGFLNLLDDLRDMAADIPTYELLWNIYNRTDIMAVLVRHGRRYGKTRKPDAFI